MSEQPFWKTHSLQQMSRQQWESLCDRCCRCCLHKIEDIDSREIHFTNVACHLLDHEHCLCSDYANRSQRVPDCVTLTPADLADPYWLPDTCSYRLLAEGKDLPRWHPLVSGNPDSTHEAGMHICGRVVCESQADDLEQHLIEWVSA